LATRSNGQYQNICFVDDQFLRNWQFLLKTKLGLSTMGLKKQSRLSKSVNYISLLESHKNLSDESTRLVV
jgi:hypothetical protein